MPERIEDFANRVGDIKEWGEDYESLYGIVDSLFKNMSGHIRGVVDLPAETTHKGVGDLIVDITQRFPASNSNPELCISLHISLGKDNLQKVYEKVLPHPHEIDIPALEEISKDEILQEVVEHLDSETTRKSFTNVL